MSAPELLAWTGPGAGEGFAWWESRLVCAPSVRQLRVGERAALFCARRQQLFELNVTAELIWRGLADARSPRTVAEDLQDLGVSPAEARRFVAASAQAWLEAGHLLPAEAAQRSRGGPDLALDLRVGDLACALELHAGAADPLRRELQTVFGQFFAPPQTIGLRISIVADVGGYFLLLDGAPLGLFAAERIVAEVKAVVTDQLARSVRGGAFLLHAAMLARGRRGLLIAGAPGAGKTTLTLTLAARGWGYAGDDIVKVGRGGEFDGIRFSPAVKSGAWELVAPHAPGVRQLATHVRGDGQRVRYAPVGGFASGDVDALGWALLLDRRPAARTALEPVEPLAMVAELLGAAFCPDHALDGETLQAFADQLSGAACRRLIYSDLAEAVAAIEAMARG